MNRSLLAAFAIIAVCAVAPAVAADINTRSLPCLSSCAPAAVPYYNWSGLYVGAHAGANRSQTNALVTLGPFSGTFSAHDSGWNAGGFAGYNWQSGNWVFGPELGLDTGKDMPSAGNIRGRLGYLMTNSLLAYGAAGYQWAHLNMSAAGIGNWSENRSGFNLAAGAEYAINQNWHAALEYRYTDLGSYTSRVGAFGVQSDIKSHGALARIIYKF